MNYKTLFPALQTTSRRIPGAVFRPPLDCGFLAFGAGSLQDNQRDRKTKMKAALLAQLNPAKTMHQLIDDRCFLRVTIAVALALVACC
jgi:hypothetical protein